MTKINAQASRHAQVGVMNRNKLRWWVRIVAAVVVAAVPLAAGAQESVDRVAGHELALRWCSSCHLVDPTQQYQGSDAVPTFVAVAAMKSTTSASLRVFLSTPHSRMPDFALSRDNIADLSAYILSLRK